MKRTMIALLSALLLCAAMLGGCAARPAGDRFVDVSLEGGTGRASITTPAKVEEVDGQDMVTIEWSSPNYDYMVVDGERYLPTNDGGNSTFVIPVLAYDTPVTVTADTTAMSTPHEIEYQLTFTERR